MSERCLIHNSVMWRDPASKQHRCYQCDREKPVPSKPELEEPKVVTSEAVPPGEVWLVDESGIKGRIVNCAVPEPAAPAEPPEEAVEDLLWDSKPSSYNAMPDATHNRQVIEAYARGKQERDAAQRNYAHLEFLYEDQAEYIPDLKGTITYLEAEVDSLKEKLAKAEARALNDAIKAVCSYCRSGRKVNVDGYHLVSNEFEECPAAAIRALSKEGEAV